MKTSGLYLSIFATLTPFLVTASPLPVACSLSTCHCATGLPNSRFVSQPGVSNCQQLCEDICEYFSRPPVRSAKETKVHLESEDLAPPIEGAERPLPTSVLMQLSPRSEKKTSAPSNPATSIICYKVPSGQDDRQEGPIDIFQPRNLQEFLLWLLLVVLVGVLGALARVGVEKFWKRWGS